MSATESPAELLERLRWEREQQPLARPAAVHIAISGGRDRTPTASEMEDFWRLWVYLGGTDLHHGDAPNPDGTDRYVGRAWERRTGKKAHKHPADWKGLGKKAGPIRNREMMTHCVALIAFPGARGTQTCIDAAHQQGKQVYLAGNVLSPRLRTAPDPTEETPPPPTFPARQDAPPAGTGCMHVWNWTFWPSQGAWRARCYTCSRHRWATRKEAAALEELVAIRNH